MKAWDTCNAGYSLFVGVEVREAAHWLASDEGEQVEDRRELDPVWEIPAQGQSEALEAAAAAVSHWDQVERTNLWVLYNQLCRAQNMFCRNSDRHQPNDLC